MSLIEGIIGPIAGLIDKIIPDPQARERAKIELLKLQGTQEMEALKTQLSAIVVTGQKLYLKDGPGFRGITRDISGWEWRKSTVLAM